MRCAFLRCDALCFAALHCSALLYAALLYASVSSFVQLFLCPSLRYASLHSYSCASLRCSLVVSPSFHTALLCCFTLALRCVLSSILFSILLFPALFWAKYRAALCCDA
jgi:hypothetical protein